MLHRAQLNIAAYSAWFELNSGIFVIPLIADDGGIIAPHGVPDGENRPAVILLAERLPLKCQIFRSGQADSVKALRHRGLFVRRRLDALHIDGGVWFPVAVRKPQTHRLTAERFHAGQKPPDAAAHLLAVWKIVLCLDAPFENNLPFGFVDYLNKYACLLYTS